MVGSAMMWIVFAISFVGCAVTLGFIFIKPGELEFLRGAAVAPAGGAPSPASAGRKATLNEGMDDLLGDDEAEETEPEPEAAEQGIYKESVVKMMTFLEGCLASLATRNFKFDSFNKFGCHLFLAGAAEAASRKGGLSHDQFVEMLGKSVSVLGSNPDVAKRFSEKYDEYLLEPKYAEMFRSGGDAMERFLEAESATMGASLAEALDYWNRPAAGAVDKNQLVTVMFTDLVGSTRMTQELGDEVAQRVVRKHNDVVRSMLKKFRGVEVKHTGDGIMARFDVPSNAVEAALGMQQMFADHNAAHPNLPVAVRVGLNAGEPIQEDGDIFGTTVQLAARICDKSKAGHVMTSNVVRELCAGRKIRFDDVGQFDLKGVQGKVHLYFAFPE